MCESVVLYAATMWRRTEASREVSLAITLAGADAADLRDRLLAHHRGLADICELEAWDGDALADLGEAASVDWGITTAYVCRDDEGGGLAAALALADRPATRALPIVLVVEDADSGIAAALRADSTLARLRLFGVLGEVLHPDLLRHGTNELLARSKHDHYVECELERGVTAADNPSLVPWHELDESLKESNRLFADSVGAKLEATGCAVVPAPLVDPADPGFAFSDDEIEELAVAEHDRWCSDLIRHGWRWGETKDAARKRHPSLVPWAELSEEERDKDRDPVRELPRMLARVGFRIDRVGRGAAGEREPPRRAAR
jgi:hypothetical protein